MSEAVKSRFPNPCTVEDPSESLVQKISQSVIFSGDDFVERQGNRERCAIEKTLGSPRDVDRVPVQVWYDELRGSDHGRYTSKMRRAQKGERVYYP